MYKTHGKYKTPECVAWRNMRHRCTCETNEDYPNYGGRGIKICDRWDDFENFLEDMGEKPNKECSLDRIDNDGDYCPENCRWVDRKESSQNQRGSKYWYINEVRYESSYHASRELGIPAPTIVDWCNGYISRGKQYPPKAGCYSELKYGAKKCKTQ